jgi:hypothetical protein
MCVERQSLASFEGRLYSEKEGTFGVWVFDFNNQDSLAAEVSLRVSGDLVSGETVVVPLRGFDRLIGSCAPAFQLEPPGTEYNCDDRTRLRVLTPLSHTTHLFIRASLPVRDSSTGPLERITTYFTIPVKRNHPGDDGPSMFSVMDPHLDLRYSYRHDIQTHWRWYRSCSRVNCSAEIDYELGPCLHCQKSWCCTQHDSHKKQHEVHCESSVRTSRTIVPETAKGMIMRMGDDRNGSLQA